MLSSRKPARIFGALTAIAVFGYAVPATALPRNLGGTDCSIDTHFIEDNFTKQAMDIWSIVTDANGPGSPAIGPAIHVGVVAAGGAGVGVVKAGVYNSKNCDLFNLMFPVGGRAGAANPPGNNGVPGVGPLPNGGNGLATVYIENIFRDPNTNLWVSGSITNYLLLAGLSSVFVGLPDFWSTDPNAPHLYETINLPDLFAASLIAPAYDKTATTIYSVVNGAILNFPGIFVGPAPPTFDATNGLNTGSGFTGSTVVLTDHQISTPEPGSMLLYASGLAVLGAARRRRPKTR